MKKIILCAAFAAACALCSTAVVSATEPAAPETVVPPSRSYMDSLIRAERAHKKPAPHKKKAPRPAPVCPAADMPAPPADLPAEPPVPPDDIRPVPPAPPADLREEPPAPPEGIRPDAPVPPRGYGLREDRPAPPHLRRERRHHHARRAPRYDCPFGYHHRQADCAYYHDDRGYYHPHRPAARY